MKKRKIDKAYLKALMSIRKMIDEDFEAGGWIPSGRIMCARFGMCRNTYRRAVKFLVEEGTLLTHLRKGHYVKPDFLRFKKVGIVLGDARVSPFIVAGEGLGAFLRNLEKNGLKGHFLQASDHESILEQAVIHDVSGIIWLNPPDTSIPVLNAINSDFDGPFLGVGMNAAFDQAKVDFAFVSPDFAKIAEKKADYIIERGHRKVVYVASKEPYGHDVFVKKLKEKRIMLVHVSVNSPDVEDILRDDKVTGVMIDGGVIEIYDSFRVMAGLDLRPFRDLYVYAIDKLAPIKEKFPDVKISVVGRSNIVMLGAAAGQLMADHLLKGQKLVTRRVDYFGIERETT